VQTRLLLIDPDETHLRWLARVIQSGISDVEVCSSTSMTKDAEQYDLVVMSYDVLDTEVSARQIMGVRKDHPEVPFLLISSSKHIYPRLVTGFRDKGMMNILARKLRREWAPPSDLVVTLQKLLRPDIFGLDKYFPNRGTEPIQMTVRCTADKSDVLSRAHDYAADLDIHPRLVPQFLTVVDESISNALYNGPVDELGQPRFAHLPRQTTVTLNEGELIQVTLSCDGARLGVSVVDPFGSLTRDTIFDHLSKCFRRGRDQIDFDPGGAGIGLYVCFESLSHFVINISAGRCTEVIGLIDVRGTYLDYVSEGKSFNVFETTEKGPL
jgi:hypothetical protein